LQIVPKEIKYLTIEVGLINLECYQGTSSMDFPIKYMIVAFFPLAIASCGNISAKGQRNQNDPTISKDTSDTSARNTQSVTKGDKEKAMKTTPPSNEKSKFADCDSLQLQNADGASDLFEKQYPPALIDPNSVDEQTLTPDDMAAIVRFAACAAAKTDFEPFIADNASALFASKKHGNAAFAVLEKMSRTAGFEAKAAKDFANQMREYVKEPTE
jgi:hypothetical protein